LSHSASPKTLIYLISCKCNMLSKKIQAKYILMSIMIVLWVTELWWHSFHLLNFLHFAQWELTSFVVKR
jgi:hypothetical protein